MVSPPSGTDSSWQSHSPWLVIVMGVSASGKSTLGAALAAKVGMPFIDGDTLHPQTNVEKMSSGIPLTDADREPWLRLIRTHAERIVEERRRAASDREVGVKGEVAVGIVVACSALKKCYRDVLRGPLALEPNPDVLRTWFVFIEGEKDELVRRMERREGHFMKTGMLDNQLDTLEDPRGVDDSDVVAVSMQDTTEEQVRKAQDGLRKLMGCEEIQENSKE